MTDLFATLFGNRCVVGSYNNQGPQVLIVVVFSQQVICVAHSEVSFDGQDKGEAKKYLAVVAKDGAKKGFYIRVVDKEVSMHTCMMHVWFSW